MEAKKKAGKPVVVDIADNETVVEYLNKICEKYVEELREHGRKRIADFKSQAAETRSEIERVCGASQSA